MNVFAEVNIDLEHRNDCGIVREKIQLAINECYKKGGGTVYIPEGDYVVCSIQIKNNVTLLLDDKCTLISPIEEKYFEPISLPKGVEWGAGNNPGKTQALIYAECSENIRIEGGTLIGRDKEFWIPLEKVGESWCSLPPRYKPKKFRPNTLFFQQCKGIKVSNLMIKESPVYSAWVVSCSQVDFSDCRVENDFYGMNTDGFHFSSCESVLVERCFFRTGDDSIAIDANIPPGLTKNIVVRDSVFDSAVNAFRIYTGLDPWLENFAEGIGKPKSLVKNIYLYGCKVLNAAGVLNVTAQNGYIENIECYNFDISMKQEGTTFFLMTDYGEISNVRFMDSSVDSNGIGVLLGTQDFPVKNVVIQNLDMKVKPKKKLYELEIPDPIPGFWYHHFAPCNLYIRYAEGISAHNINVKWDKNDNFIDAFSAVKIMKSKNISIEGLDATAYGDIGQFPEVSVQDSENITLK